jgi:3-methylcrotonyl-CoA carboxylase alpha subunit
MNTRLQVEHPVTEAITGLDLVEWQLRVASGERLPKLQEELAIHGHAFEARIYAENPRNQFLPAIGKIEKLRAPARNVRIDTGVREGDEIRPNYDPMIAKLIVHAPTRSQALARLADALDEYAVMGFANNVEFLQRTARHPAFQATEIDTGFITRHNDALLPPLPVPTDAAFAACALIELNNVRQANARERSPWARADGFWLGQPNQPITFRYAQGEQHFNIGVLVRDSGYMLHLPNGQHCAATEIDGESITLTLGTSQIKARVLQYGLHRLVLMHGARYEFDAVDPYAPPKAHDDHGGHLTAPMPGSVVSVLVKAGDKVTKGQPLIVMEAMKMEHTIVAPFEGKVEAVYFAAKEQVKEGAELVALEAS